MQALLEAQHVVEAGVGEDEVDEHLGMARTDPVDAPVALCQPHGIPGRVVVGDVAGLLQVHALGQHVGGDHDVVAVVIEPGGGVGGTWCESPHDHVLVRPCGRA